MYNNGQKPYQGNRPQGAQNGKRNNDHGQRGNMNGTGTDFPREIDEKRRIEEKRVKDLKISEDLEYVEKAEGVIKYCLVINRKWDAKKGYDVTTIDGEQFGRNLLSTNQIRNILEFINQLYDMVRLDPTEDLSEKKDVLSNIQYVRMKLVYLGAKDEKEDLPVKDLLEKSGLLNELKAVCEDKSRKHLLQVCRYTEALVAFHKYYPHKEDR